MGCNINEYVKLEKVEDSSEVVVLESLCVGVKKMSLYLLSFG